MGAVRERPCLILSGILGEPADMIAAPGRIVARLGHAADVAGNIEPALEAQTALHIGAVQPEEALEGLVGENQLPHRIELRHTRRQQIEQRALRLAEGAQERLSSSISSISTA
jgi:hypothetical protein